MEKTKKIMAIINPVSSNGKTGRRWPEISALLQRRGLVFDYRFTQASGDARNIAQESLEKGYETLISIGGDGTLNEIVNGFFLVSEEIRKRSTLGVISMGTGGDFVRTAGIPKNAAEAVLKIAITSPEKILIEMDGETPGWTPLEIEIIPKALRIII